MAIAKIGGDVKNIESFLYKMPLKNSMGTIVTFNVYGIEEISSPLQPLNTNKVTSLFQDLVKEEVVRPEGEIDVLIGLDLRLFTHRYLKMSII